MKTTALNSIHKKEGAKMVSFAGFEMPIEFSGIKEEHMTVRNSVGVFDVSHMGEIWIKGEGALDLLKKISSNNPETLKIGEAQYTCFPNGKGGIVDDFISYYYEPNKYMLVVNASNIEKDFEWIKSQNEFGAIVENSSDEISQLAIQGPKAIETVQKVTDFDVSSLKFYTFSTEKFAGIDDVIISATGYTGAGGVEIYFKNKDAEHIYNVIMDAGKEFGIKPIGLAARDTLRLEMGYCLYGNDIDDTTSPIEAGLGWITKFNNNRQFIDRQFLEMQKKEGVSRRLRGFVMKGKAIPRKDYTIVDSEGNEIGVVTSGTMSPVLENGIGMGYLNKGYAAFGTQIFIKIRKRVIPAEVVKTPFI